MLLDLSDNQVPFGLAFFHRMLILGGGSGNGAGDVAEQLFFYGLYRLKCAFETGHGSGDGCIRNRVGKTKIARSAETPARHCQDQLLL